MVLQLAVLTLKRSEFQKAKGCFMQIRALPEFPISNSPLGLLLVWGILANLKRRNHLGTVFKNLMVNYGEHSETAVSSAEVPLLNNGQLLGNLRR
jgi:hypothetical protein